MPSSPRTSTRGAGGGGGAGAPAGGRDAVAGVMGEERAASLDRFDRVQLADVLGVCQASRSLADAGRVLFARSRGEKATPNDSDRIRKYLLKFGLHWKDIHPDDSQPEGASEAPRSSPP